MYASGKGKLRKLRHHFPSLICSEIADRIPQELEIDSDDDSLHDSDDDSLFDLNEWTNDFCYSVHSEIVSALLHRGALANDTLSDLNPATAHLVPRRFLRPSTHILKMLLAAGA